MLEGGGMKGIAYAGAIEVLDSVGITPHIKQIAGTSSGALNGFLLAVGYSGKEIRYMNEHTKFGRYDQVGFPLISGIFRLRRSYGYYKTDRLIEDLRNALVLKNVDPEITFEELHQLSLGSSRYKSMFVTGTNLSDQSVVVFSHFTSPQMKVIDAVNISLSIPVFYEAKFLEPDGRLVDRKEASDKAKVMVDGGMVANFPFFVFDTLVEHNTSTSYICNKETIGIKLELREHKDSTTTPVKIPITGYKSYMKSFSSYTHEVVNNRYLSKDHLKQIIFINTNGFNPRIRKVSAKEKTVLMEAGSKAARRFLKQ